MRLQPPFASRRLSWSCWLVLVLMALCLPLQGALAVTMQMGMALPSLPPLQSPHAAAFAHALPVSPTTTATLASADTSAPSATQASQDVPVSPGMHAAHQAGMAASMPCHEGASGDQGDQVGHAVPPSSGPTDAAGHSADTHHGCSFCAQCCIGAALLATPLTVAATPLADAPPVATPATLQERQPATPDRPPKLRLA